MKGGPNPKIFLVLTVGTLVLGIGMCYLAFNGLSEQQSALRTAQAERKDVGTLQKDLATSHANLQETSLKLQHLEQGIPDFAYVPTMLAELEKVGKSSGIDVIGVRPMPAPVVAKKEGDGEGEKPRRKAYEELTIEVKGRGNYRSVMNFVKALGSFPKVVSARTINLAPKTGPEELGAQLDVTIELRAYVFPAPQPPKNAQTAMKDGSTHAG